MFEVNDRIRIVSGPWASDCGTIRKIRRSGMLLVALDITGHRGLAVVQPSDTQLIDTQSARQSTPADFDRGFGIGGLGRYEEPPVIPSDRAIERMLKLTDTDVICRRCGASMNFDGAMFTTGGCDICDDCF